MNNFEAFINEVKESGELLNSSYVPQRIRGNLVLTRFLVSLLTIIAMLPVGIGIFVCIAEETFELMWVLLVVLAILVIISNLIGLFFLSMEAKAVLIDNTEEIINLLSNANVYKAVSEDNSILQDEINPSSEEEPVQPTQSFARKKIEQIEVSRNGSGMLVCPNCGTKQRDDRSRCFECGVNFTYID